MKKWNEPFREGKEADGEDALEPPIKTTSRNAGMLQEKKEAEHEKEVRAEIKCSEQQKILNVICKWKSTQNEMDLQQHTIYLNVAEKRVNPSTCIERDKS